MPTAKLVQSIFCNERNQSGQMYMVHNLKPNGHYTSLTMSLVSDLFDQEFSTGDSSCEKCEIPYCFVPNTSNYRSQDGSYIVINHDQLNYRDIGLKSKVTYPISQATEIITRMFMNGIEYSLEYDTTKRSAVKTSSFDDSFLTNDLDTSDGETASKVQTDRVRDVGGDIVNARVKANSLPQLHVGWTNQACHAYSENTCTMAGNVKPSLKNGNLPKKVLLDIIKIVELVLDVFPEDHAFNVDKLRENQGKEHRQKMFSELKRFLGGSDSDNVEKFRVEGITLLIPASIGWHRDTMNDNRAGFKSVLSVNVSVPMNNHTLPFGHDSYFGTWLTKNGFVDEFPCSIILYSREAVGGYCEKMALSDEFASKDIIYRLIKVGMIDRVGEVVDYRSTVFHNDLFPQIFLKKAKSPKSGEDGNFQGLMWARTASYDRIVSSFFYIDLFYLINYS